MYSIPKFQADILYLIGKVSPKKMAKISQTVWFCNWAQKHGKELLSWMHNRYSKPLYKSHVKAYRKHKLEKETK
jgi:hypothetical protein